jgi:murein DD-endopeptidase MepM/ murein hydrolase activator NlpD
MPHELQTFRTIAVTVVITSAAWVTAGALWLDRPPVPQAGAPPSALMGGAATRTGALPVTDALPRAHKVQAVAPVELLIPVSGVTPEQLIDTFTQTREGGARVHDAIDILAPRGTPVVAAAAGKVEKLFLSKPGGNTVYMRSRDGSLIYYYAHLDSYAAGLAEGQDLAAGALLGLVGSTGNANPAAPHLHFAVMQTTPGAKWWEPATAINPYPLLTRR